MKQTAVEWLIKEFSAILGPIKTEPMQDMLLGDAFKKAKAMEEEQIGNAVIWFDDTDRTPSQIQIEVNKYYNETYKP
jgi:hypothetical protein